MSEERKQNILERQTAILVGALQKAQENGGVLLNGNAKTMPVLMDKPHFRVSPVNALMMAMHADQNEAKTNVYTLFNEAKNRGESVRSGMRGVPFTWTNNNEYVSKDNAEDKISKKEFLALPNADKAKYTANPKEDAYIVFNIDQTTMPNVHKDEYDKQLSANGGADIRAYVVDDKQLHIDVNQFILSMRDNLVKVAKTNSGEARYNADRDTVYMPAQKDFPSYADYVQEIVRQIAQATAIPGRLNRTGSPSADTQEGAKETLVVELASAHKMLELGMPAKLRPETIDALPSIIDHLKENPQMTEDVMNDVRRTVGMMKKAENGEKINLVEAPGIVRQQEWDKQFPMNDVPQKYDRVLMVKDDDSKWTLYAKPENERSFAIHPSEEDAKLFFNVIMSNDSDERKDAFRAQFAQKYYQKAAQNPKETVDLFKSNASSEALALINKVNIFKSKDEKLFIIASLGDERQKPKLVNPDQWQRAFIADDSKAYKIQLAAQLYSKEIGMKLEEAKQKTSIEIEGTPKHEEKEHREYHEKEAEEQKRQNSPEQKEKEKQEEKAKEEATKQETKAVATIALSPMLKQFMDLKKKHPDALLLFRCGDFYETYKEDAEKASKILGITLTKSSKTKDDQGKPLAMAGFPYHALDTYLPKLIRAGQRVAICDQIEAPKQTAKRGINEMTEPVVAMEKEMQKEQQPEQEQRRSGFHR